MLEDRASAPEEQNSMFEDRAGAPEEQDSMFEDRGRAPQTRVRCSNTGCDLLESGSRRSAGNIRLPCPSGRDATCARDFAGGEFNVSNQVSAW